MVNPADLTFRVEFRDRLIQLRKDMGLRQKDLGVRVGRGQIAGSRWENAATDWRLGTVDLWVRSLDHQLVFDLRGPESAPATTHTQILRASRPGFDRDVALLVDECRRMRVGVGLTARELAHILGISRVAVSHWENGRSLNPRISSVQRYARGLGGRFVLDITPTRKVSHV